MKKYILIFLILMLFIATSCTSTKKVVSNYDSHLVKELLIFPIYTKIDFIEKRDKRLKSEPLSYQNDLKIKTLLNNYIPDSVKKNFFQCSDWLREEISNSGISLIKKIKKLELTVPSEDVPVPQIFLNVLDSVNKDYGLFVLNGGFTRSPENLVKQYIVRREIAVATLGLYNTVPNKAYSVMIAVIIDRKRKKISYYKELYWRDKDPSQDFVLKSQIRDLMLYYFQTTEKYNY